MGKTTVIRELARSLADDHARRVIIIDTSNEIGGDGDVPHPGIGGARRMQVGWVGWKGGMGGSGQLSASLGAEQHVLTRYDQCLS